MLGWPVLGPLNRALDPVILQSFPTALVGIGHAPTRLYWLEQLSRSGISSIRDSPHGLGSPSASLGYGMVVSQSVVRANASSIMASSPTQAAVWITMFTLPPRISAQVLAWRVVFMSARAVGSA